MPINADGVPVRPLDEAIGSPRWYYGQPPLIIDIGLDARAVFRAGAGTDPRSIRPDDVRAVLTWLAGYDVTECWGTFRDALEEARHAD